MFTFVAQHSIHLVYQSLQKNRRKDFTQTTTLGTILSTMISIFMGFFAYMTFWENTSSAMFELYSPSKAVDICRILLCISMLLTYPFPFLTVRELLVVLVCSQKGQNNELSVLDGTESLGGKFEIDDAGSMLQPGNDRQLKRRYHIALTLLIWFVTLVLALGASSLGAVLNLTGCATGTVISYILPAVFSYKLRGHTTIGTILFLLGGSVGIIGTYYSIVALF